MQVQKHLLFLHPGQLSLHVRINVSACFRLPIVVLIITIIIVATVVIVVIEGIIVAAATRARRRGPV